MGSPVSLPPRIDTSSNAVDAWAFAGGLNIPLKTVRLYGFEHKRTATLSEAAWSELRAALHNVGDAGLLLGVSGSRVLLDGAPLGARGARAELDN